MTTFQAIEIIEIPSGNSDNFDDIDNKIEAYQFLIDNGIIWKLQGIFGRTAVRLIDDGSCSCDDTIPQPTLDTFLA
jgi:hypothetical protein